MIHHFNNLHPSSQIKTFVLPQSNQEDQKELQEHVDLSSSTDHNSTSLFDNSNNIYDTTLHSPPNYDLIDTNITIQGNSDVPQFERQLILVQKQFQNINSQFFVDKIQNHGHGICGITSKAFSQSRHCQKHSSLHEALFHFRTTYFCSHLTF